MAEQTRLADFKTEYIVSSYSEPEYNHLVVKDVDGFRCSCKGFYYKGYCHHVLTIRLQEALKQRDYYAVIKGLQSHARFKTFQQVMDCYSFGKNAEHDYLCAVAMGMALDRPVCADDLHTATNDQFASDPRLVGSVLGGLMKRGLLEIVGRKKSERAKCHHRVINLFALSEEGKKFMRERDIQ